MSWLKKHEEGNAFLVLIFPRDSIDESRARAVRRVNAVREDHCDYIDAPDHGRASPTQHNTIRTAGG